MITRTYLLLSFTTLAFSHIGLPLGHLFRNRPVLQPPPGTEEVSLPAIGIPPSFRYLGQPYFGGGIGARYQPLDLFWYRGQSVTNTGAVTNGDGVSINGNVGGSLTNQQTQTGVNPYPPPPQYQPVGNNGAVTNGNGVSINGAVGGTVTNAVNNIGYPPRPAMPPSIPVMPAGAPQPVMNNQGAMTTGNGISINGEVAGNLHNIQNKNWLGLQNPFIPQVMGNLGSPQGAEVDDISQRVMINKLAQNIPPEIAQKIVPIAREIMKLANRSPSNLNTRDLNGDDFPTEKDREIITETVLPFLIKKVLPFVVNNPMFKALGPIPLLISWIVGIMLPKDRRLNRYNYPRLVSDNDLVAELLNRGFLEDNVIPLVQKYGPKLIPLILDAVKKPVQQEFYKNQPYYLDEQYRGFLKHRVKPFIAKFGPQFVDKFMAGALKYGPKFVDMFMDAIIDPKQSNTPKPSADEYYKSNADDLAQYPEYSDFLINKMMPAIARFGPEFVDKFMAGALKYGPKFVDIFMDAIFKLKPSKGEYYRGTTEDIAQYFTDESGLSRDDLATLAKEGKLTDTIIPLIQGIGPKVVPSIMDMISPNLGGGNNYDYFRVNQNAYYNSLYSQLQWNKGVYTNPDILGPTAPYAGLPSSELFHLYANRNILTDNIIPLIQTMMQLVNSLPEKEFHRFDTLQWPDYGDYSDYGLKSPGPSDSPPPPKPPGEVIASPASAPDTVPTFVITAVADPDSPVPTPELPGSISGSPIPSQISANNGASVGGNGAGNSGNIGGSMNTENINSGVVIKPVINGSLVQGFGSQAIGPGSVAQSIIKGGGIHINVNMKELGSVLEKLAAQGIAAVVNMKHPDYRPAVAQQTDVDLKPINWFYYRNPW